MSASSTLTLSRPRALGARHHRRDLSGTPPIARRRGV